MKNYYLQNEPAIRARLVKENPASEDYIHGALRLIKMKTPDVVQELKDVFQDWTAEKAVFIEAATGMGKSTVITEHLFPHIANNGGRLLIVSNRIALNTQYKMQLLKQTHSPALEEMTPLGIQRQDEFEGLPVVFCSYQGLPGLLKSGRGSFTHAVFDEAHFFCADSLFARDTGRLLEQIPKAFQDSVRIYMSATPWAVRNLVAETEQERPKPLINRLEHTLGGLTPSLGELLYHPGFFPFSPRIIDAMLRDDGTSLLYYQFPAPKRSYRLCALPSEVRDNPCKGALLNLIKKSPKNEKWVIFINSKKQGIELAEMLNCSYLDAESKAGSVWTQLTTKSSFPGSVLVTTPVTDCGVNIIDDDVKHVVLFSTDHVQFLQELGRKRLRKGETINIYVPDLTLQQLNRLRRQNDELIQALNQFNIEKKNHGPQLLAEWHGESQEIRELIPVDGFGRLYINRGAEQFVRQRNLLYQELEQLWAEGHKHPFIEVVCRWLDLSDIDLERAFCRTVQEEMLLFLGKH